MLLTERQSLQLTIVLMEAAEDKGDKQGFVKRAKEFFKRLIESVKGKISKFASFIKDKIRVLLDKLHVFEMKLKGKSSEEISASLKERKVDRGLEAYYKDKLASLKANVAYINKHKAPLIQMMKEANKMYNDPEVSIKEYNAFTAKVDDYLDEFKENLLEIGLKKETLISAAPKARTREKLASYSIFSHHEALKVIYELRAVIREGVSFNKEFTEVLADLKKIYLDAYALLDRLYKTEDTHKFTIFSKLDNLVNSMGSAITKIWSNIFQLVGKLFGSFRKKKEERLRESP